MNGTLRVIRGGAADGHLKKNRSAWRGGVAPIEYSPNLGFRVVATPKPKKAAPK